ncbi:alkaline phosphatase D family protein [Streptomyces sp. NPDC002935]|uniref:alkaline phosphatase D family protein n=1 Tax=Streptomyces sp. NPDC002935 TaxID=3154545 RepID=UPI0033AF706A
MAFDVKSVWAGALTSTSVRVIADTAPATAGSLLVADNEAMTGPVTLGPISPTTEGILAFTVTGLTPNTRYWYVVDAGGLNVSYKGTFKTHPGLIGEPASYLFGAAGDAGLTGDGYDGYITSAVSNSPVFDTMTAQSRAEDWAWFSHLGDLHYRNITTNDVTLFRAAYDDNFNYNLGFNPGARQGTFLRGQAITYIWDDHDFGGNNSDRTVASRPAAQQVYRECVPSYPLADAAGIYQSWQVGRVLYVATDSRSFRDPNSNPVTPTKTMLGTAQKTWLENLLTTSSAEALVWQSSSRWVGGTDTWQDFPYERAEMVQMFGDTGWLDRMLFMTADMHSVSISTGPNNPYGRFPMFMFAGMDAGAWATGTEYDLGSIAGRRQYGTMRVQDNGHTIALTGTGYHDGTVLTSHTAYVHVGTPVFALDYAAGHVSEPLSPTDDDQGLRNEITAQRDDGGEYTYAQTTGPNNTGDPAESADAVGLYEEAVSVNVSDDDQLPDQASWRVHLGTVDEDRYPRVRIDLAKNPGLADEVTGLYVGDRVTIANPPAWMAPDVIDLIAEGGTETVGHPIDWDAEFNASPGSPWTVAQLPRPQAIVHGTFETDLGGFTGEGGAAVARVAAPGLPPFDTSWSVRITPDGVTATGGAVGTLTATSTVIPGEQYLLTMWAYSATGMADVRPGVHWYDQAGTLLSSDGAAQPALPAGVWTLMTSVVTAPANATRAKARARHGGTPAASAVWHADEVAIWETRATGYSAGPNKPNRWDTSGSQLVTAVTSSATQLIVHTPPNNVFDRSPWINSTGLRTLFPTHFPFDLRLGGETVRVTAIEPGAWDTFTRTTSNGWGSANSGQAWTSTGGATADYSTNGSVAAHSMTSVNVSRYSTVTAPGPDLDMRADVSTGVLATGGPHYLHLTARWTDANNNYTARLGFTATQTLELVIQKRVGGTQTDLVTVTVPGVHVAATFYTVRFQLDGSSLRAKAWPRSVAEPGRWHATVTDTALTAAGSAGVRTVLSSATTNTLPVTTSYDNFEITTPQRVTVQRSINTVVKAQTAGTAVSLAQPAVVAL